MDADLIVDASAAPAGLAALEGRVLFRSDDLLVRAVTRSADDLCYVTFDSYTDNPGLDRDGFGERHFRSRGISAIHVISRNNRWYQHPELPDALAAVACETAGRARVIAYGSSMGGFAALTYGSACGAHVGLALSPQFSLKRGAPPYDRRWAADVRQIRFLPFVAPSLASQHILYDPRDRLDREHASLFAQRSPSTLIAIPYGGHPVGSYVNETGMFDALFAGVADNALSGAAMRAFERQLRDRRHVSGHYFFNLAVAIWPKHLNWAIKLAQHSIMLQPECPSHHSFLGFLLDKAGRFDQAIDHHRVAISAADPSIHSYVNLIFHHAESGGWLEARQQMRMLRSKFPASRSVRICARRLRWRRLQHLYDVVRHSFPR